MLRSRVQKAREVHCPSETESVKLREADKYPSSTIKVILAVPKAFATGVILPTQLGQVPLQAKASVLATKAGLSELYNKFVFVHRRAPSTSSGLNDTSTGLS